MKESRKTTLDEVIDQSGKLTKDREEVLNIEPTHIFFKKSIVLTKSTIEYLGAWHSGKFPFPRVGTANKR
jgi:hypothetical protein